MISIRSRRRGRWLSADVGEEAHSDGLLEYPQYTRPAVFRGEAVPEVVRSGNHQELARWKRREALRRTRDRRPDLIRAEHREEMRELGLGE